jgi:hypothetical protein
MGAEGSQILKGVNSQKVLFTPFFIIETTRIHLGRPIMKVA